MIQVQLKLRPTKAQERTFERWLWMLTGTWNWAIKKIEADAADGVRPAPERKKSERRSGARGRTMIHPSVIYRGTQGRSFAHGSETD